MPKPFMTYEQQIQKLKDKHLVIEDEGFAKDILHRKGYFALISGYKNLFKNPTTRDYWDGTRFEDIVALYRFDERLRELTLRHLLHVERHVRSALSYAFCDCFGDAQTAYLDRNNYHLISRKRKSEVDRLIDWYLKPPVTKGSSHPYVEHNRVQHGNVPLWVLVNALSFGTLSKMYEFQKPQIQTDISHEFEGINERQLGQCLQVLTNYRNVCAHNERLFSYRCAKNEIPDLPIHGKLGITKKGSQYIYGKRDFFAVVVSFRYLLPNEEFKEFKAQLAKLIDKAVEENQRISETTLLAEMGFPVNWKMITRYKKI